MLPLTQIHIPCLPDEHTVYRVRPVETLRLQYNLCKAALITWAICCRLNVKVNWQFVLGSSAKVKVPYYCKKIVKTLFITLFFTQVNKVQRFQDRAAICSMNMYRGRPVETMGLQYYECKTTLNHFCHLSQVKHLGKFVLASSVKNFSSAIYCYIYQESSREIMSRC